MLNAMNLDARINALIPGRSIVIGSANGITTKAERSGDGKTLRFVRESRDGFVVFQTRPFGAR